MTLSISASGCGIVTFTCTCFYGSITSKPRQFHNGINGYSFGPQSSLIHMNKDLPVSSEYDCEYNSSQKMENTKGDSLSVIPNRLTAHNWQK